MRKTTALRAAAAATAALLTMTACSSRRDEADRDTAAGGACKGQQTTGITDDTIKLGGIYPLSGPASAYGTISKGVGAYFQYVNDKGGIAGRKVRFIVRDDGYQPPKAVEEARRLVEREKVFAVFQTLGTPSTAAVWEYLDKQKVPQPFVATGASVWGTDARHPWTIGWQPNYVAEARVYAKYLKDTKPKARVAVLYQNDDFGKDLLGGFEKAVAGSGVKVVARESYEVTDPSVSAQMASLSRSKADVLLDVTTPKFGSQALAADARNTGWNPLHIVNNVASSAAVLKPVGFKNVQGVVSATYFKDPADPQWADDPDVKTYKEALHEYAPDTDPDNQFNAYGWAVASSLHKALESMKCPTREGLRDAVRNLKDVRVGMLLPGVTMSTGHGDAFPLETMQLMRFKGERWQLFGKPVDTREEFGPLTK
ncbi:ABC transporter substrate-binding protein [Streptomyces sp. PanSC9]|uniref:ABC transporter substrate-binding protein n=1 Tax=Streptomyces sp. PanSC9 TaxID=1520461 RepID=UPI000F473E1A|nr:ABC transporter substrate-binding protein [Streptomyces sp. PanSC9]ROP55800.1 amino acid/amide ABC transporter substrate-binding protein (HAAT family) [Streptomyces sp. PanSC9]